MRTVAALLRLTLELPLNAIARNPFQVAVTDVIRLLQAHKVFFVLKARTARNPNNCEYDELISNGVAYDFRQTGPSGTRCPWLVDERPGASVFR